MLSRVSWALAHVSCWGQLRLMSKNQPITWCWQFITVYRRVSFLAVYCGCWWLCCEGPKSAGDGASDKAESEVPTEEIVPPFRRDCQAEVYCGSHTYPGRGVYLLKFDNSYSLWRSKTLYYRVYYTRWVSRAHWLLTFRVFSVSLGCLAARNWWQLRWVHLLNLVLCEMKCTVDLCLLTVCVFLCSLILQSSVNFSSVWIAFGGVWPVAVPLKCCKIGPRLLMITSRKFRMQWYHSQLLWMNVNGYHACCKL